MRFSAKKSSGRENGLQYKLMLIEALVFILPVLTIGYIFWKDNISISFLHAVIIALVLILVLTSMIFIRQIFERIIKITHSVKMAEEGEKCLIDIKQDTSELHLLAVSFNNLMGRFEKTTDELGRRTFELLAVKELIESANRSLDLDDMLKLLLEKAMAISGSRIGSVLSVEPGSRLFRVVAYQGREAGPQKNAHLQIAESMVRHVVSDKKPLLVQDIESDPRTLRPNHPRYKTASFFSMPIFVEGRLIAILNLADKENGDIFDSGDEQVLTIMISEIGFALENAILHATVKENLEEIHKHNKELALANQRLRREVADRKQAEKALHQSKKMEAIGTLAGGVAHEFNNLLGIIMANTEMAMLDMDRADPSKDYLEEIQSAALRAGEVVSQILSFARKTPFERKPLHIRRVVEDALKLIRAAIPATIEIRQDLACEFDTVKANTTQINQVLMNLCANARSAMSEDGGVLEIKLENVVLDASSATEFEDTAPGKYVRLTVGDTGHGIDPKIIGRIFEPYFTTKSLAEGTGMGLAVVYGILKKHDGTIRVQSDPGRGTLVELLFPCIDAEVKASEPEATGQLPAGNERILFVDDEKGLVKVHTDVLTRLGYDVVALTHPVEALRLFKAQPDRFDLVLTDMTMPAMTGKKLAREVLKIRPDIPIVLCTGYSEKIDEDEAKKIGIKGYITKPFVKKPLAIAIRRALDGDG